MFLSNVKPLLQDRKQVLFLLFLFPQCIFMGELWGPYFAFSKQLLWCKMSLFGIQITTKAMSLYLIDMDITT